MERLRGYYSIVQYCPDRGRMETANVGVVLLCPERNYLEVRMDDFNDRPKKIFRGRGFDAEAVQAAKRSLSNRIRNSRKEIGSKDALQHFADTRGNDLLLTAPRSTVVENPERDLERLFAEMVGEREYAVEHTQRYSADMVPTGIKHVVRSRFRSSKVSGYVQFEKEVMVPATGKKFVADVAYQNGALNLVRAEKFTKSRMATAELLAAEAHLLQKTPTADGQKQRVILVPEFGRTPGDLPNRIDELFKLFDVRVVHERDLADLVAEAEAQAHD